MLDLFFILCYNLNIKRRIDIVSYDANSIQVRSFRQAVQATPAMYLGAEGQDGIFNCFLEILNNSCDEAIMGRGQRIVIDLKGDTLTCVDMGAGIPHGPNKDCDEVLIELMVTAHSSGKFNSESYSRVRGLHGVGQGAVCMCSEQFEVWTRRDGGEWYLKFINGEPQDSIARKIRRTTDTGTTVKFTPNRKFFHLSPDTPCFDAERIRNELELTSYFIPNVTFVFIHDEKEEQFYSQNGLRDFAAAKIQSPLHKTSIYNNKHFEGDIDIEVFAQWTSKKEQCYVFSNGAANVNGGSPTTGMKTAFTRTINELSKNKFDSDMIRKGLVTIINIKIPNPIYKNQVKDQISNPELKGYTQTVFTEAIKDWARKHPDELDKIIGLLSKEQKAEDAANRAREAILNHEKLEAENKKKKFSAPIKLMDCEKHGQDSILYITEGRSAKTPVQNARQISHEAVYDIRGKIISALKNPLEKVLENEEVSDILQILGCGILDKYNEKKLNFGKLLIFSDRDEDGGAISNLLVTLIYVLMPDFIKQHRLGRVIPPLFKVSKGNKRMFFYSNEEYNMNKHQYGGWQVTRYKGKR